MNSKNIILKVSPILFGFFIMGFVDIVGITSDYVQKSFHWSHTVTGFVPFMVFIWFLFFSIPIGNQMNKWGRKNTVLFGMAVTIAGMILPLLLYNGFTCFIAYALLGIGNTFLQVSLNPLLNNVLPDNRLLTSSLTAGQVIKAISSLLGPELVLLAISLYGVEKWYYCFPILGLITTLSALWLYITPIKKEVISNSKKIKLNDTIYLLKDKQILLLFFGILFIVGVDVATNFISSKIMAFKYGWDLEEAKFAPQLYFLCRTIGAFLGAFLLSRWNEIKYFRINIILCIAVILVLSMSNNPVISLACIGAIGFFASSVFPIIFSIALKHKPENSNEISGLMITAVAGGAIIPPLIGLALSIIGIIGGFLILLLCIIYLTYLAFSFNIELIKK